MVGLIIGAIVLAVLGGVVAYQLTKPEVKAEDVYEDFKAIKKALIEYKKVNLDKCKDLKTLKDYLGSHYGAFVQKYGLTPDEKFMVVIHGNISNKEQLIEKIGGSSYYDPEKKQLFLSMLKFKVSKVEPKAVITYYPKDKLTTTTSITWSHEKSIVDDNIFKQVEWKNKQEVYPVPGEHVVDLRVQDMNENWSEWVSVNIKITELKGVKGIAAGGDQIFKIHQSGAVEAFGKNKYGQMGNDTLVDFKKLSQVRGLENVAQVACGDYHTIFRKNDGGAYACGNNDFGQLGIGSRTHSKSPKKIWGIDGAKRIYAGPDYSAALLTSGAVLTWGNNENGQLGEDKIPYREAPKRVSDVQNVKQMALSETHVVCVCHDGTVIGWGDNSHGQLGNGFKGKHSEPAIANIASAFYAAAGKDFTVVALDTGKVKCFGHNNAGQLGMQSETDVLFPKEIPGLKGIVKVAAHDSFVIAMTDIGEVYTWGRYSSKESDIHYTPQKIHSLKYVTDIAASNGRGYALTQNGQIMRWNGNIDQLEIVEEIEAD